MGRTEGRDHGRGAETHHRQHARGASRPTTASTISSPQTNWLPRADHFWLGQSLFGDAFTWYEHSNVGYAQFKRTTVPDNVTRSAPPSVAAGPFNYLPWEQSDAQGGRFATRQEIDWPFQLGVVKVVPYALGEAAHWGEDINGNPLDRLFWQAGVRAEHAHVVGRSHRLQRPVQRPRHRPQGRLRRRVLLRPSRTRTWKTCRSTIRWTTTRSRRSGGGSMTTTFGVPSMIDRAAARRRDDPDPAAVRRAALRPADRLAKLGHLAEHGNRRRPDGRPAGVEQRWQTKRGPADDRHIIDWITLDTNVTFFPDPNRDNFGQPVGLLDYDFRWHVGDRLTLVSDAIFDFFNQGQKIVSVGGFLTRPPRGSLYVGFRILKARSTAKSSRSPTATG